MYNAYVYLITIIINTTAIIINGIIVSGAIAFFVGFIPKETVVSLTNKLLNYLHVNYAFTQTVQNEQHLIYGWTGFILLLFIALSLTPIADIICKQVYGFGKPLRDEREKLTSLFNEVCKAANKKPEDFKLYVTDDDCLNACALGFNNIAITRKLLLNGNNGEIKAVLAHEMGHIHYGDSVHLRVFVTVNIVGQIALWAMKIFAAITGFISRIPIPFINIFVMLLSWFSWITILVLDFLLVLPLSLAALFGCRRQEYRADEYACGLGFGKELYSFLLNLLNSNQKTPRGLSVIWQTHPSNRSRLINIDKIIERKHSQELSYTERG